MENDRNVLSILSMKNIESIDGYHRSIDNICLYLIVLPLVFYVKGRKMKKDKKISKNAG